MDNGACYHVPTLSERLWKRLGFVYHLGDEPEDANRLDGWMRSEVHMNFSFFDRLRLLATGKLHIILVQHTTAQVEECRNRVDWQIKPPISRHARRLQ